MKKRSIIIGAGLVATWLVVDAARDFSDAVQYFLSQPYELFYVVAIAILGGLAALGYDRLSARTQRRVRVFAWGATASTPSAFVGYFAFRLVSLSSLIDESSGAGWPLLALLLFGGVAVYLWFEFYHALKTGFSR